ncbi:hypothetical protein Ciccas_010572, partial [Cichlidogyrus casuarinus]
VLIIQRSEQLQSYRAEVSLRLSDWDSLRLVTTDTASVTGSWSIGLARMLYEIHQKHWITQERILDKLRLSQMTELSAAAMDGLEGGYERAYSTSIMRLGILAELDWIAQLMRRAESSSHHTISLDTLLQLLESRADLSRPTFHTMEPLLAVRHAAIEALACHATESSSDISRALGNSWLTRARVARKAGQTMAAFSCVLRAEARGISDALIERAKLLWQQSKAEACLNCLDKGIEELSLIGHSDPNSSIFLMPPPVANGSEQRKAVADSLFRAKLLRARYSEEIGRYDFDTTRGLYDALIDENGDCEEAHFRLAAFVDHTRTNVGNPTQKDTLLKLALKEYAQALSCGSQFIYQSMPRFLSMWLDHGSEVVRRDYTYSSQAKKDARKSTKDADNELEAQVSTDQETFKQVQQLMKSSIERIPVYQFYSALGQMLSRVCHEHKQIVSAMINLIVRLCEHCPQQTLWFLISQHYSSVPSRSEKCSKIFEQVRARRPDLAKMIADYVNLCRHLTDICSLYMTGNNVKSFSLKAACPKILHLLEASDFSSILIPVHSQLVPTLPAPRATAREVRQHLAFGPAASQVTLVRFEDQVEILSSQTKPKKMSWVGSDGRKYIIVAKPNDDMRKDYRLTELNTVINKFLAKNSETRRRALQIRTFAVIPLSEKGGLVEWVNDTQPLRTILVKYLQQIGRPINWPQMVRLAPTLEDSLEVKREKYLKKWLPMFPLVFHMWFTDLFGDPSAWYAARDNYARSLAVMSMVGYVLGLGDRHTENILLDATNGAVVHVDFSCVFNYGLTLPWPERVPFRLTRNLVHALGPTGYEGVFRRCSEAVMRLLRNEIDPIMAVFKPIYHDALVEQGGSNFVSRAAQKQMESGYKQQSRTNVAPGTYDLSNILATNDRVAKAAAEKLSNMEHRLKGKITEHEDFNQLVSMSVEGQVDELIHEATDVDRLCRMYRGWMPFL